ncbi:MAG TPA: dTMP kinase [Legionella sp.]|nr:dTMP kinase [Legionella sp.]
MRALKGQLIVVEGLEGAGKSTALDVIKQRLAAHTPELILTREPGGTHVGEVVRGLIKASIPTEPLDSRAELLLFYAARVQLLEQVIRPALNRGAWVLADRFELSTFAYQGGGRELDETMISHLSSFCVGDLTPDLTIFLDVSPELGLERAGLRGAMDRIEQEPLAFFRAVHDAYHRRMKTMPHVVVIDASQPLLAVRQSIAMAVEDHLAKHVKS